MELNNIVEICVAIDIAILGIAYPIIIDKISNIGDKYSSNYLSEVFNLEFPERKITIRIRKIKLFLISIFRLILVSTVLSFIFIIFEFEPLFGWNNEFINNSANLLVLILTFFLTYSFFVWLDKVILYNGKSTSLLKYLIKKYTNTKNDSPNKSYYLKVINEFAFYAINRQDEHLQETLLDFYSNLFYTYRQKHESTEKLVYPIDLYLFIYKLNEVLANGQNGKLYTLEHRAVSGIWFLGEDLEQISISEETYNWLWQNLYVIHDIPKFVKIYWGTAFQYFDFKLHPVDSVYNDLTRKVDNQNEIDKRKNERERFLEFHYALGGLLLYRKQYGTLNYIFNYTQSQPPRFVLLPESMTTIFKWFSIFSNESGFRRIPLDRLYSFPELDNLGNRSLVSFWICCYLALLFIRQYSLNIYYTFQNFTSLPSLPDDILKLNHWLGILPYFRSCLEKIIANKELLQEISYTGIVEGIRLDEFFERLELEIKKKIGNQKENAPLDPHKLEQFKESTETIIKKSFNSYKDVFIELQGDNRDQDLKFNIIGTKFLMIKSAFTENDITHLNYDSIGAAEVAQYNIGYIPNLFSYVKTKRYLLNRESIHEALDKIIDNQKDIVIVAINMEKDVENLIKEYNSIIKSISSFDRSMDNVLFVLKDEDLPRIEHNSLEKNEIEKDRLELLNENIKLYASVVDINRPENEDVKKQWSEDETKMDGNFNFKVQVTIALNSTIYWKKKREVIQINISSPFKEQGIVNDMDELKKIGQ